MHRNPSSGVTVPRSDDIRLFDEAEFQWRRSGPTPGAVRAFEVQSDALRPMAGGAGYTWTDGRLVLKPVGYIPEHDWVCDIYAGWGSTSVRVPEPVRPTFGSGGSSSGRWSFEGWGAHVFVPGRDADLGHELPHVREASNAFHDGIKDLARPSFMDVRNDPWAFGDRVAWEGATPVGDPETLELIRTLASRVFPVSSPAQAIHGDILPNVLLSDRLPPAVIDWPVYFRPVGMANAIAVTDAVTFRNAPLALLGEWETGEDWNQMLVRALLYRLGATGLIASRNRLMGSLVTHVERARPVVDAMLARI